MARGTCILGEKKVKNTKNTRKNQKLQKNANFAHTCDESDVGFGFYVKNDSRKVIKKFKKFKKLNSKKIN